MKLNFLSCSFVLLKTPDHTTSGKFFKKRVEAAKTFSSPWVWSVCGATWNCFKKVNHAMTPSWKGRQGKDFALCVCKSLKTPVPWQKSLGLGRLRCPTVTRDIIMCKLNIYSWLVAWSSMVVQLPFIYPLFHIGILSQWWCSIWVCEKWKAWLFYQKWTASGVING